MDDVNNRSLTSWNCTYHIAFGPKYTRKVSTAGWQTVARLTGLHLSIDKTTRWAGGFLFGFYDATDFSLYSSGVMLVCFLNVEEKYMGFWYPISAAISLTRSDVLRSRSLARSMRSRVW